MEVDTGCALLIRGMPDLLIDVAFIRLPSSTLDAVRQFNHHLVKTQCIAGEASMG